MKIVWNFIRKLEKKEDRQNHGTAEEKQNGIAFFGYAALQIKYFLVGARDSRYGFLYDCLFGSPRSV